MPAVAAKAWGRIPPALCLGLKWNALSALWPRPSDYPARWACPKSNDWGLFVAHFVETLCRKSPQTAVSDKVGDEVVTTMWIKTVALGQALPARRKALLWDLEIGVWKLFGIWSLGFGTLLWSLGFGALPRLS